MVIIYALNCFLKGCYRFSDGSFMKYLNYSQIISNVMISAPIFNENDHNCNVNETIELRRDGQDWETTKRLFSATINNKNSATRHLKELEVTEYHVLNDVFKFILLSSSWRPLEPWAQRPPSLPASSLNLVH